MTRRVIALALFVAVTAIAVPLISPPRPREAAAFAVGRVHADFQPMKGKVFVLVIGNDARSGNPDRSRADAIHIAGINTRTMRGGILNFPRDSWVSIPGYGTGKINESLYDGGPRLLAKTLENITGIHIDYWVMVGFEGFRGLIRDVGPITIRLPYHISDPSGSGANLPAGKQKVGSWDALSYVRTRHSFPHGDIDRTTNQAKFLLSMLRKLGAETRSNPAMLLKWMSATRDRARLDISPSELYRLGLLAALVKPERVGNVTVPVNIGSVGAASVVFIQPSARAIYKRFRQHASLSR